jgi:hypothetical protein
MPKGATHVLERLLAKVTYDSGCWLFTGCISPYGYGRITVSRAAGPHHAHRVAYENLVGPIPDGHDLDHLCRNRACCNPLHLEPVTRAENWQRAPHANREKTQCPKGHAYTSDNVYILQPGNRRDCLTCRRERGRRASMKSYYAKKAAEQTSAD